MLRKFLLIGIVCLCVQIVISQNFKQQCLRAHNRYRRLHNAPNLVRNATLTRFAQQWANRLARTGTFQHRPNNPYGENLYAKFGNTNLNCATAVKAWYDEISKYNFNNPGFTSGTGHFTQVVWKNSRRVGCARATKGTSVYVVCNYDPPGNVIGQFPANVQRATNSG